MVTHQVGHQNPVKTTKSIMHAKIEMRPSPLDGGMGTRKQVKTEIGMPSVGDPSTVAEVEIGMEIKMPRRDPNAIERTVMVLTIMHKVTIPLLLWMMPVRISVALAVVKARIGLPRKEPDANGSMATVFIIAYQVLIPLLLHRVVLVAAKVEIGIIKIEVPRREPNVTGRMVMVAQVHFPPFPSIAARKALVAAEAEIGIIKIEGPRREPNVTGRMVMVLTIVVQAHIPLLLLMIVPHGENYEGTRQAERLLRALPLVQVLNTTRFLRIAMQDAKMIGT